MRGRGGKSKTSERRCRAAHSSPSSARPHVLDLPFHLLASSGVSYLLAAESSGRIMCAAMGGRGSPRRTGGCLTRRSLRCSSRSTLAMSTRSPDPGLSGASRYSWSRVCGFFSISRGTGGRMDGDKRGAGEGHVHRTSAAVCAACRHGDARPNGATSERMLCGPSIAHSVLIFSYGPGAMGTILPPRTLWGRTRVVCARASGRGLSSCLPYCLDHGSWV